MIFFIYDLPALLVLGYFFGWLFAKKTYVNNQFYALFYVLFTLLFWLNAILSNFGLFSPWLAGGARTVIVDSVVFGVFYLLSFPLFFSAGSKISGYLWGNTPYQNGLMWLVGHDERAKPFPAAWASINTEEQQ